MNHRQRESILCRVKFDICAALPLPLPLCVSVSLQNHTGIFKTHMLLFPLRAENIQPAKQKHVPKYLNYVTFMQNFLRLCISAPANYNPCTRVLFYLFIYFIFRIGMVAIQ